MDAKRRTFLKAAGFSFPALLAGCGRAPVQKAIPYLVKPEEITPGRAYYYSSTCGACPAGCGALVKNRDGRPIKLEGNPDHPLSRGGLCAVGQASILGLYDSHRLRQPLIHGKPAAWGDVDAQIAARLRERRSAVRFLTGTIHSPTLRTSIGSFLAQFPNAKPVAWDAIPHAAILDAHELTHGARVLPRYRLDRADVIVSFDADFLATWISPVEFTAGWRARRTPPAMSYHVQFEGRLSLTGSKADRRVRMAPEECGPAIWQLADAVAKVAPGTDAGPLMAGVADRLRAARGRSLVLCGSSDVGAQVGVNYLNHLLGNYGSTVDIETPSLQAAGSDEALVELEREMAAGKVDALFIHGVNPVYHRPGFAAAVDHVPLVVSFASALDETSAKAHYVCPDHHWLESWGDAEPVSGTVSLFQPAIEPLSGTRSALESLAAWSGVPRAAYEIVRGHWQTHVHPRQQAVSSFEEFWRKSLETGVAEIAPQRARTTAFNTGAVPQARTPALRRPADGFSLVLYPKPGMLDGAHAHNPWLHELPDPVTKVTWDNYACLAPAAAARLGVETGDVVRLEANGKTLELPALVQPGQHRAVIAVAIGYGRSGTERFTRVGPQWLFAQSATGLVGVSAAPLSGEPFVRVTKTGRKNLLASAQSQGTIAVPPHLRPPDGDRRPIVRELSTQDLEQRHEEHDRASLWPKEDHPYKGFRWGMAIDLNACTGCSACVMACQAENNIPVVGRDEVARKRAMHWIRIDRYYDERGDDVAVAHQPMMCQQCGNAPCETVCPVLATVHSSEGLNQQVYNRCVGTRYCENNCPYKARRFNWFEYARADALANLVLNPDVTVRSRGVMEKCTFCVQRIQEHKIDAKVHGRRVADGEIQTACQQSCPAQAILFGDLNDPKSRVAEAARSGRAYRVLEETNVEPSVTYLALVRNRTEVQHG